MHILLVDDNNDTRHLFGMAFVLAGHRAKTASNGVEALALFHQHRFDVVVLDVEMPHMSGWKVLEAMRQVPFGEQVPVILFTAYHDPSFETQAQNAGAYALLRKPIFPGSLLQVMERAALESKESSAGHAATLSQGDILG
ncbi:MAG: two-component system, chemotaxis family, chemotaxis protein CheY [Abditibacteriota bacterium]|nr:two-component system, chemotaxis family, chemotaxis protein CheY [Abditibacteriota bacterium]